MFILIVIAVALAMAVGAAIWLVAARLGSPFGRGPLLVAAVAALMTAPATAAIGYHVGKQSQLTFHEFWNGVETRAVMQQTTCTRDGACVHVYQCDPYLVPQTYTTTETYTKSDGSLGTRTVTKTRMVTKYHSCPYVDAEYTYTVATTLDDRVIGSHWFPANPQAHEWRPGHPLPAVPSGVPAQWLAAKRRIAAGTPAGVTTVHGYDNYILASQTTILRQYSDAIGRYRKLGLLPDVSRYTGNMTADKVHFVGPVPTGTTAGAWQSTLARLNGAFGYQLQGDLHVVLVTDPRVTDPDNYTQALHAYWQSPQVGKDALSKNGLVVVIGSHDGSTAAWVRAFTGMPVGNEALLTQISSDLTGATLRPATLLGAPTVTNPGSDTPVFAHTGGLLDRVLWGPHQFHRVCMGCHGTGDTGVGYDYLSSQIQPSGTAKTVTVVISTLLSALVWGGVWRYGQRVPLPTPTRFWAAPWPPHGLRRRIGRVRVARRR